MARYHGRKGAIYLSTTGSGNASSVIALSEWSVDRSTDTVETTAFQDTNKTYVQGLPDLTGSFAGFWDNGESKIFSASDSADGCKIYIYPSTDAPTYYAYGPAWLSYSLTGAVGDAVKVSANFSANGAWGFKF